MTISRSASFTTHLRVLDEISDVNEQPAIHLPFSARRLSQLTLSPDNVFRFADHVSRLEELGERKGGYVGLEVRPHRGLGVDRPVLSASLKGPLPRFSTYLYLFFVKNPSGKGPLIQASNLVVDDHHGQNHTPP